MQTFKHINATTVDQAATALKDGKAALVAGGTDLLGILKDAVLPTYPETLVNLKTIASLDSISDDSNGLKIGSLVKLSSIARHATIQGKFTALAQAAGAVGSPDLRNMGTIGGNICQQVRCWYYRASGNYFNCLRKTGNTCYAIVGDHRYHSIFGAASGCIAVNPSDVAPALVAMGASIKTNKRTIAAQDFFVPTGTGTALASDEIVTEVQVPALPTGAKSAFVKFAARKSIDFPIANCAAVITQSGGTVTAASIVLNAVAGAPRPATTAETYLVGKTITEDSAQAAGDAAVEAAAAFSGNKYIVQIARTMVKRAILACK